MTEERISLNKYKIQGKDKQFYAVWVFYRQAYYIYYKDKFFKTVFNRTALIPYLD